MDDAARLTLLKIDLQITTDKIDPLLSAMLAAAAAAIKREGISLSETVEDGMMVIQYASYLYRKRREQDTSMPRYLRWMLNNRLLSQKMGGAAGG